MTSGKDKIEPNTPEDIKTIQAKTQSRASKLKDGAPNAIETAKVNELDRVKKAEVNIDIGKPNV